VKPANTTFLDMGIVVALQALVVEAEKSAQCSLGEFQRLNVGDHVIEQGCCSRN
jgi:hypothetical protein